MVPEEAGRYSFHAERADFELILSQPQLFIISPKTSVIYYPKPHQGPGVVATVAYLRSFDVAGGVALFCTGV